MIDIPVEKKGFVEGLQDNPPKKKNGDLYKSPSQIAGAGMEMWFSTNAVCTTCGGIFEKLTPNTKVKDFFCLTCKYHVQVKTTKGYSLSAIQCGSYNAHYEAKLNNDMPCYLVHGVRNKKSDELEIVLVWRYADIPSERFRGRKELSEEARRRGYKGTVVDLRGISPLKVINLNKERDRTMNNKSEFDYHEELRNTILAFEEDYGSEAVHRSVNCLIDTKQISKTKGRSTDKERSELNLKVLENIWEDLKSGPVTSNCIKNKYNLADGMVAKYIKEIEKRADYKMQRGTSPSRGPNMTYEDAGNGILNNLDQKAA